MAALNTQTSKWNSWTGRALLAGALVIGTVTVGTWSGTLRDQPAPVASQTAAYRNANPTSARVRNVPETATVYIVSDQRQADAVQNALDQAVEIKSASGDLIPATAVTVISGTDAEPRLMLLLGAADEVNDRMGLPAIQSVDRRTVSR